MRYPVALFDVDGTLLDTSGTGIRALNRTMLALFGLADAFEGYEFAGRTDLGIMRDAFLRNFNRMHTDDEVRLCLDTYLGCLGEELARPGYQVKIMPGIPATLAALQDAGVVLGLATGNLRPGAEMKLKAAGIMQYFTFGGFGSDHIDRTALTAVGAARARERLGRDLPGSSILVIGDSPLDIKAAHGAGLHVLSVCTGWNPRSELEGLCPDHLLDDLSDSARVLEIIRGGG